MIISRKRFLEEINKAKQEVADEISKDRYLEDRFNRIYGDMNDLFRRVSELEYQTRSKSSSGEVSVKPIN